MINVERINKYLEETGLGKRLMELKLGDSFGVEIPIDEENEKFLRFWLAVTGETEAEKRLVLDFEGLVKVDIICDEEKLTKWIESSGFLELAESDATIKIDVPKEEVTE